jgi:hypothetical protein
MKTNKVLINDLQSELSKFGIKLKPDDIASIVTLGVDKFLKMKGVSTRGRDFTRPYLIVTEYKSFNQLITI